MTWLFLSFTMTYSCWHGLAEFFVAGIAAQFFVFLRAIPWCHEGNLFFIIIRLVLHHDFTGCHFGDFAEVEGCFGHFLISFAFYIFTYGCLFDFDLGNAFLNCGIFLLLLGREARAIPEARIDREPEAVELYLLHWSVGIRLEWVIVIQDFAWDINAGLSAFPLAFGDISRALAVRLGGTESSCKFRWATWWCIAHGERRSFG